MYSKNNKKMIIQKKQEKINYYGIKKFKIGTASVLIAAGFAFLGSNAFASDSQQSNSNVSVNRVEGNTNSVTNEKNVGINSKVNSTDKKETLEKTTQQVQKDQTTQPTQPTVEKQINKSELVNSIKRLQTAIDSADVSDKTKSAIEEAKLELISAKSLEQSSTTTQEEINRKVVELKNKAFVLESMKKASTEIKEEKVNKNTDPRNGKAITGKGESGFREAATANPIIPATEGPTNNNKRGSGNNPADGVFESAKDQFGDIDFSNATEKSREVKKQWSRSTASQGGETKILGSVTYNWKEKEITANEANNNNALNGWKIESGDKITAVKPEAPTNVAANRPEGFDPKPSKVYDLNGKVPQRDNEHPVPGNPLGVNAANQNYANGVNHSGMVGTHSLPKGYYLELGKKGTKISKEYSVNGNSRVMLSAITGGAYGNAGTAGTGERVRITVYDAVTGEKIYSVRDDQGIGTKYENEHVSTPTGSGGNGDGWTEYRAIYEIPKTTSRVKVEIEALDDGTAINNSYLENSNSTVTDGYFVGAVNLAVGTGTEMTTNVKTNGKEGKFGEDNLYKSKQKGELEFTVNSVGGVRHYGLAETEIEVPEGVDLPENITKPTGWVWIGDTPIAPQNISWDAATRKLKIKYQTSGNNAGVNPYIGIGSNNGKNDGVRKFRLPFTTTDDYRGTATFKVRTYLPNGLSDGKDNQLLNTGDVSNDGKGVDKEGNPIPQGKYNPVVNGVRNTDQPDYYYNKTIYIDSKRPTTPTVEVVHTDSIRGEKKDENQVKELLVSIPTKNTELTNEEREKKDVVENDKNNGVDRAHTAGAETIDKAVDKIDHALGGLTTMKVTLPNSKTPITLTKKEDGWYIGSTKVEERDGKLVVPVLEGTDLTEANETTNPDKRIKVTVLDKAGNESDPAYGNVKNEAPTVDIKKKDIYVYKTKATEKWTNEKVLEKAEPTATDLEDDRDGIDSTKPTIAVSNDGGLDTTKPGDYIVRVQSTDSEGKKSDIATTTVHVLDLITVDPTVTNDPENPSTSSPVSPKDANTPVKAGDNNRGTYPPGVTHDDLVKEVTRTIKYIKEADKDNPNAKSINEEAPDRVQKVTYKRTATVNPETKEVMYSDWTVYNEGDKLTDADVNAEGTRGTFRSAEAPVISHYLQVDPADKVIAEKEAPIPGGDGTVTPEVVKVLYKEVGSFVPNYPAGKKPQGAPDKIYYPNNSTDSTILGDFSTVTIPYVAGYTPVYNGKELTPKNPNDPTQGYKVPDGFTPTDKFGDSPITYTASTQTAKVVIEKKVDGAANEVVSSFDLTGKSGSELPESTNVENKIKELKNQGYEVEIDEYHIQDNHRPTFDDKEDINATDGSLAPSQTFKIVVKPRIVEVPSSTPHEKDSPVDPNGETPELKWPEGLAESDLNTSAKRVISYVKKESDTAAEEKAKDDTIQKVSFTRKARVNLVTKEVTYTDWESPNKSWNKVEVGVLPGYIADKKEIPAKEVATPDKNTKVIPDETEKVTYTKIGSWIPVNPTTGKDGEPIPFPNDPNDPTKTGEITQIIPHKDGYTPKDGNGTPLEPVNPANPEQGYKPPKITDPKANIKITYDKDDQKAKVKFVSVDPKTQTETELTEHALTLTGKTGEIIPESDVQTRIDVLKSMGYDIVDNPFDKDPVFDTKKDTDGNISQEFTIKVKPRVSTAKTVYVVEGDKPSSEKVGEAVTPGKDGKVTNPDVSNISTEGKAGQEIKVPVTVTYGANQFKRDESVEVTVKVLPKPTPKGIIVAKDSDKEKAKEKVLAKAKESIEDSEFKGKLPANVTNVSIGENVENPDLSDDTDVNVTVKYIVDGEEKTTVIKVPVTVVEGVPQIVPVDENNKQPNPENSIDKIEYPDGSTFEYDPKTPIDTTTPGDYKVNVIVKDKEGNPIAEVPATVRVVESYPQFVSVDKDNKQPNAEGSIDPKAFPKGTEFSYETPVDTSTPGEKDVVVVAKIGDKVITKIPAKIVVVEPKTQYVAVDKNNKQPDASKSIDPEQYPDGITFKYKAPVDTTTPGEKDVIVEAKDGDDTLVEVPAKVKVVEGKEQLIPVNPTEKPQARDSITPGDYPEGSTFEYKVPDGETEPFDATTIGDKPVTVVVKDKNGKVLVEVPATIKVVEAKPTPIETPVTNTPITKDDIAKYVKVPEGGKVTKVENIPDLTTPGKKNPVKVTVTLPNGKTTTVEVPVNVTPVKPIETPMTTTPLTPEDYTKGIVIPEGGKVTNVENIPDLTTPGKKNPVKVTVTLPNGKVVTVEVPVNVTPVKPIETPVIATSFTPEDYTKGIVIPEGGKVTNVENIPDLTTPGKKEPVKVTVELPNGKVITVEVPVNVTPVKPIETPVTATPFTPEDYTKGIVIPEGGKVKKVENIPDLTTPGKKDPVKVTVELPNGKVITVEVPVYVTPVKPIETPVTTTPFTPEDYTKGIKIPEGGKVTKVENIPDLTTPGKKTPVKVTIELPNGKVIIVEVPVNVTPVKGLEIPVTKTPLQPEDYTKGITIPEGGKVTKVENIPDLTTPGKKTPVKVTVELPNGKVITVEVPITVTPATGIETPVTDTPLTKEDIEKHVKVPEGGKIIGVGEIPKVNTPGDKGTVKVKIELPNGKQIEVEVPVNVTPIKDIVKKLGEPITNEEVEKHVKIPKGGKVISIGDKPSTDVPGERPSIPVVIELPGGKRVTVKVPVIVTPKTTPIVVKVGTPITQDDVKKHVDLPEGWKITKVGEIPTTTTPGNKPSVTVEIELPDGRKVKVDVPVIVTPKTTPIVVKVGTPITQDDVKKHVDLPEGWKITKVGEIPTTTTPGNKPSVTVEIELPDGRKVKVDVPVIVTPNVTPIVVEVGTPITQDDVKKHVDLPEGWKITKVGEIPTTTTPGEKTAVPVEIELPNGQKVTVNVPVKVIEKQRVPENNTNPNNADNNNNNGNNNHHNDNYGTDNRGNENNNIRNGESNDKPQDIVTLNNTSKKAKVEKLPNTGVESNSIAGYGLAILGIALSTMKRRKEK